MGKAIPAGKFTVDVCSKSLTGRVVIFRGGIWYLLRTWDGENHVCVVVGVIVGTVDEFVVNPET